MSSITEQMLFIIMTYNWRNIACVQFFIRKFIYHCNCIKNTKMFRGSPVKILKIINSTKRYYTYIANGLSFST